MTSYKEVVGWAETMRDAIDDQRMPPWHANPHYGKFTNDARLSSDEKRLVTEWIENGLPEGDASQLPAARTFTDGWQIPTPDLVVKMPKPFTVPAQGVVEYQVFTVDRQFDHDVWIHAAEGRPSNRSVVHHMVLFYMPAGQDKPQPQDALFNTVASSGPGVPALIATGRLRVADSGRVEARLPDALHAQRQRADRSEHGRLRLCRSEEREA